MKNRILRQAGIGVLFACLGVAITGCESCKPGRPGPPGKYAIEIKLDDSLKSSSVLVDLVGANGSSLPGWEAYDMGLYWKEGDAKRRDADKKSFNFLSGQTLSQTMDLTDPKWDEWKAKGVTHILVLADLPGPQTSHPGTQDARRQILPLDKCAWPAKTTALNVLVQRSGIVVLTPARSVK
jgi:hypothetical protein